MHKLNASFATKIRVRLLMPVKPQEDDHFFVLSSVSPAFLFDPHSSAVLFEVPATAWEDAGVTKYYQTFLIKKPALRAWKRAQQEPVAFTSEKKDVPATLYFTAADFNKNTNGHANVHKYLKNMVQDYQTMFHPLVDKKGVIRFNKKESVEYGSLEARIMQYFIQKFSKGSDHCNKMSKEVQALPFLTDIS